LFTARCRIRPAAAHKASERPVASRGAADAVALTRTEGFLYIARSRAGPARRNPLCLPRRSLAMSRRCELTGVGPMVGHNVSHSNIKSKRRFLPALSPATLQSEALGQAFTLRITNAALRTLDFKGGLDAFLLKARDENLSARALKIKRQLKAKLGEQPAA
jgi:large subunit ribosomal protein L28